MKDIYEGECIQVWEDDEIIFIGIFVNGITLSMPKEEFYAFIKEIQEIPKGKLLELKKKGGQDEMFCS